MMLLALSVLAQSRPDFTGFWRVNFDKSVIRGQAPKQILMKIEHREPKLVQTILVTSAADETQRLEFTFETTGKETVGPLSGGTGRTRAHWDGSELVIESSLKTGAGEFHFKDHWSLSGDGRVLTMAHRDDDLAGQITVLEKAPQDAAAKFNGR
jgi:hypothetical protein